MPDLSVEKCSSLNLAHSVTVLTHTPPGVAHVIITSSDPLIKLCVCRM